MGQRYQAGHSTVGRIQRTVLYYCESFTNSWKAASRPTEDLVKTNLQCLFLMGGSSGLRRKARGFQRRGGGGGEGCSLLREIAGSCVERDG